MFTLDMLCVNFQYMLPTTYNVQDWLYRTGCTGLAVQD